jgi:hypothetical protein
MNDFSEIQYGIELLASAYKGPIGDRLKKCLETIDTAICQNVERLFDGWSPLVPERAYLACFSEHNGRQEDKIGRLSMWRAYGGPTSVAIVLNNGPFLAPNDVMEIYASPVLYADRERFNAEFDRLTTNIEAATAALQTLGREEVHNRLFRSFLFAALCTKHLGFYEEREWRVIYTEQLHDSANLRKEVETVRGVPQFVYKIALSDIPGECGQAGFHGAEVRDLLDRIIIGPSDDGLVIRDAFIHVLEQSGVLDARERVVVSGIPLR